MTIVKWNEELHIGHAMIDEHRQKLVTMINDLHVAIKKDTAKSILGGTLGQLHDYAAICFAEEEKLFAQYNYPAQDNHKLEHRAFLEKIQALKTESIHGNSDIPILTRNYLLGWHYHHFKVCDTRLKPLIAVGLRD